VTPLGTIGEGGLLRTIRAVADGSIDGWLGARNLLRVRGWRLRVLNPIDEPG
jgi:hypothetical protein